MVDEVARLADGVLAAVIAKFPGSLDDFGGLFEDLAADFFYPGCQQLSRVGFFAGGRQAGQNRLFEFVNGSSHKFDSQGVQPSRTALSGSQ